MFREFSWVFVNMGSVVVMGMVVGGVLLVCGSRADSHPVNAMRTAYKEESESTHRCGRGR